MTSRACGCGTDAAVFGHTGCALRLPWMTDAGTERQHRAWAEALRRDWAVRSAYKLRLAGGWP